MSDDSLIRTRARAIRQESQEIFRNQTAFCCLLASVFLLILGARLWFIHHFALPVIFHDDWQVEGELFRKYVEGHLSFGYLVSSYKGHRMLIPRLFLLGLFFANGRQWDPLVFMVAQAPFYAFGITLLVAIYGIKMNSWGRAATALFATAVGMIPFGWENAVFGCNVDFPMFTLFGILVICFCWRYEALSWRWWVGAFLALTNLFVMGGGIFSTIAITIFTILGIVLEPARRNTRNIISLFVLSALVAFGIAIADTRHTPVVSLTRFFSSLAVVLAWPDDSHSILCFIIQAPLVLLAAVLLIKRSPLSDARWLPVIIGSSFWIQAAATVHQRMEHLHASRYRDSWILLTISIAACLYFLLQASGSRRRYIYLLAMAWAFIFLDGAMAYVFHDLPTAIAEDQRDRLTADDRIRQFLRTGNEASLGHIIYKEQINPNSVREMLPPELLNPNTPLVPAQEQHPEDTAPQAILSRESDEAGTVYGEYNKDGGTLPKDIRLSFKVPKGTREIGMLVAGHVDLRVASYHIRPLTDSDLWQSITVPIDPNDTGFDISASGNAMRGMTFSAPTISNHHTLGRWTRDIVGDCAQNSVARILLAGLVLMAGALIRMTRTSASDAAMRSLAPSRMGLHHVGGDASRGAGGG
jgi:hypothetical protein